jgi:peptide/nickel transport system substrate-binding protein
MRAYAAFNPNELVEATTEGGSIATVDPAACYDTAGAALIFNVYDTLVRYDVNRSLPVAEQGQYTPDHIVASLATNWTIKKNDPPIVSGNTSLNWYYTYYFKIRQDVPFQNSSFGNVTPGDVEYCFERGMALEPGDNPQWMFYEPLLNGANATYINGTDISNATGGLDPAQQTYVGWAIDEAVESNDTHVWFNLAFPGEYSPFLEILTQTWSSIYSKNWTNSLGRASNWNGTWGDYHTAWYAYHFPAIPPFDALDDGTPAPVMMGSGPFKFDYLDQVLCKWSVVRFADYWRGWPASNSTGYLDRVTLTWADSWTIREAKFIAGEIDICAVPRQNISDMLNEPNIRCVSQLPGMGCDAYAYQFNINKTSPYGPIFGYGVLGETGIPRDFFGNAAYGKYVRQAFSHLVGYDDYIHTVYLGEATQPATALIPPLPYYNASIPKYDYNATAAEELFKQWPGLWDTGFNITLLYNNGNIARKTVCESIANHVNSLNEKFHAQALGLPWNDNDGTEGYLNASTNLQLPVFPIGWLADYPDPHNFVYPYYYSQGNFARRSHYSNATMDDLIDQGIRTPDGAERAEIYSQIQQLAFNDCPNIPLANAALRHFEQTWVHGWYYNPVYFGNTYYYEVWKEQIPTMSVRPSELTVSSDQEFGVNITIDYAENLYGYDFSLSFNNSVLNAVSVEYTGYLGEDVVYGPGGVDNTTGWANFSIASTGLAGVTGSGTLATVHFTVVGTGTSCLNLYDTCLAYDNETYTIPGTENGTVTVPTMNLAVESIVVVDQGCTVYANDTYADGVTSYCVPVNVTVINNGTEYAWAFNVSLTVYSSNVSLVEDYVEWRVPGLAPNHNVTLTYSWHPTHTGNYSLTAMADCHYEVPEWTEVDNTLVLQDFPVALKGDVYGVGLSYHHIDILDVVQVGLAWHTRPGDTYWDLKADLNHDGYINILDIVRITLRWHQSW